MKRVTLFLSLCAVLLVGADLGTKDCIEELEQEVVKIVASGLEGEEKEAAINRLKIKLDKDYVYGCETEFENEVKTMLYGDKTPEKDVKISAEIKEKVQKAHPELKTADYNAQDCIENFSADVMSIIYANPNNPDKEATREIMHEILQKKVQESCEDTFEKDVKKAVHTAQ